MRTLLLLLFALISLGCRGEPPPAIPFRTGFWFWSNSWAGAPSSRGPVDDIYCKVGSFQSFVQASLPEGLPKAGRYWLVLRYEGKGVPSPVMAAKFAEAITGLEQEADRAHLMVAGIQLDVDSPTRALADYAAFLRAVRKVLPPGWQLSITALVDWFRPGTGVADVIRETDEFVPQFYDLAQSNSYDPSVIAAPVDGAKWGPVFSRYRKRFRIGVSMFGRTQFLRGNPAPAGHYLGVSPIYGVRPLDLAGLKEMRLNTSQTPAHELVLHYRAIEQVRVGYAHLEAGDEIAFIFASPDSIRTAVKEARTMGGYCGGVIFFRWPGSNETLTAQPDEVLDAIAGGAQPARKDELRVEDRVCAAVHCVDIYLVDRKPFDGKATHYRVESSTGLEYFVPEKQMPVRMTSEAALDLVLPPYCGRGVMLLGRAVSLDRSTFQLKELP